MKIFNYFFVLLIASSSIFAQIKAVPIAEMNTSGLMGGWENGKWLTPAEMKTQMKQSTEFLLIGPKGVQEGGVTIGKMGEESQDVCQDFVGIEFEMSEKDGVALGSNVKWNPAPRVPTDIALDNATYKTVIANFLKSKGILKPVVKLTQAMKVDLEGDGVDEVLLTATYYKNGLRSSSARNDYSVILLRKAVGKTVTNHMLEGDFILKDIDFGAPSEYKVSGIADLNGDGVMEVITYGAYYEGEFAGVYEMKKGKPTAIKALGIGCGV